MNKKGRKYDREKWGWKSKDEINEHCHYSGLPSPLAYTNEVKHPYYDSDKKKKTEKFSLQAIGICIIVMLTLAILSFIL